MYQVIEMYGDWEPWWFIDGWQDDIVQEKSFDSWPAALAYFEEEWQRMKKSYPSYHSQKSLLATFWREDERRWCEDCDEELQQYHSLLLLKDRDIVPKHHYQSYFEQRNDCPQASLSCKLGI
ncbi:TPA: DUF1033 family protein [Streptococcus equi subsp. zooepidemicus]|uniref:DUF1033 family protein n=1 Tax=Streptococcus equi TaxID=1336 RepID=UPI0005B71498|nr:DUF1033 family protein [Streptococcus equi]KIQ75483.1 dipicolinate synthase [Streptococcus equi subsp. zooepidemicus]KIS16463.1 DNA-binding protein [Streptococcus equi subsp. zooepidemicus SzAM60]MCD3386148.1 DUF1033 family protein [Streptococcus equi subsp. zooepidemicus]MCD3395366.1 DUF1033 family protein [Streptococcus equi subsp. zooepidemicus]MCD3417141.1 DUF1033 family protein [Streptococcus equi subsp. zooepidemicus]